MCIITIYTELLLFRHKAMTGQNKLDCVKLKENKEYHATCYQSSHTRHKIATNIMATQ